MASRQLNITRRYGNFVLVLFAPEQRCNLGVLLSSLKDTSLLYLTIFLVLQLKGLEALVEQVNSGSSHPRPTGSIHLNFMNVEFAAKSKIEELETLAEFRLKEVCRMFWILSLPTFSHVPSQ